MKEANLVFGIVEDDYRFLGAIVTLLKVRKDVKEILEFTSAEDALSSKYLDTINFLIIDIRLSGMDGISFLGKPDIRNLKIPKLLLSGFNAEDRIFEALKYGATGYLFKAEIDSLDATIDILLSGEAFISPTIALRVISFFQEMEITPEESEPLTKREKEILTELCEGYSIKTISKTLNISVTTLRVHIRSIYRKLEVNNQRQLMKKAKDKNLF
ncbi:MAG: response regulator transcription factor [Leptospiraceae bacterium]|nr:response regulator transcription factor [Leptospiraceae bacterium]MBK9499746.1 response regulator transcription factor [Leptospiraceae bacterium]MBL0262408.1 response regulator transcription factor [Leptospiraceae bacterium]MBP9164443.1 response regulator transcription factor [Leptospiraceae bacterium]